MADIIEIADYNVSVSTNSKEIEPELSESCSITYGQFFTNFLLENRPCVFQSDITREWRCRREWNMNGAPNFEILLELFGMSKHILVQLVVQWFL